MHGLDEINIKKFEGLCESDISLEEKEYLIRQYGDSWKECVGIKDEEGKGSQSFEEGDECPKCGGTIIYGPNRLECPTCGKFY